MKFPAAFKKSHLLVCLLPVLFGCSTAPELAAKSGVVPDDVDFSGEWQLRLEPGSKQTRSVDDELRIRIPKSNSRLQNNREERPGRSSGPLVQVFLETGELLKISQTAHGLFISFDRSIVEEYTFGEKRTVSVGPIEALRVSGWEKEVFVVETLDKQGAVLMESWHLEENGDVLVRDISMSRGKQEQFTLRQLFDRS